ncbi:MAG: hypothetical protein SGBAC_003395 [Bacillariaceae sp.]
MSVLASNMMGGTRDSLFSLTIYDEQTYCSDLSGGQSIDSEDEDSDSFISEDDDYLDAQMMKGDFILERPLDITELDRMFEWGVGVKPPSKAGFEESKHDPPPPQFKDAVHDFALKCPTRRNSITDDLYSVSKDQLRSDTFGSVFSICSGGFDSNDLQDSLKDSDDDSEAEWQNQSKSFTSLLGFEDEDMDDQDDPASSNGGRTTGRCIGRDRMIKQVMSMSSMVDEAESITDSANIPLEDRWTEGDTHEKLRPSISRWREGVTSPDKSLRPSIERPLVPPRRRRHSNSGDWNVIKRHSIQRSSFQYKMVNSQIQAEIGLQLSDSLPAQKILEAIISVLQNPEEGQ